MLNHISIGVSSIAAAKAFYDATHLKPETTFGNVKADVLADKDPSFRPENFCRVIRASAWPG